ncbi:P-loop NTPase fold protein [Streptomyces sp. NPDC013953]|uniref:P-loop NTPase fold protein n=1 Tax=Streptomyces sp. NPDC013953 TaxID=3364868 RepID=UPI0036FB57E9
MPEAPVQDVSPTPFEGWRDEEEEAVYRGTVDACLDDPRVARRLDARPGVTADAVREAMHTEASIARALEPCASAHAGYRRSAEKLNAARRALEQARSAVGYDVRSVTFWICVAVFLGTAFIERTFYPDLSFWRRLATAGAVSIPWVAAVLWVLGSQRSQRNLRNQWTVLRYRVLRAVRSVGVRVETKRWSNELRRNGTGVVVHHVIDALLGDDPHSVLVPDSYDGLRAARGPAYIVPGSSTEQLERTLSMLEGGTVAVCGPRGVGKTTLLDHARRDGDFTVAAHVPATYAPHDFLLSLFVKVCERYIAREGHEVPRFTRLSGAVRLLRRLRRSLRLLRRRVFFAVPAAVLVALGSAATVRSLWHRHHGSVWTSAESAGSRVAAWAADVWRGENLAAGLAVTVAGLGIWRLRRSTLWRRRLRAVPRTVCLAAGGLLLTGPVVSLPMDAGLRRHTAALFGQRLFLVGELVLLLGAILLWVSGHVRSHIRLGEHRIPAPRVYTPAALCCLAGFAMLFWRTPDAKALLLDEDHPTRLVCAVAGWMLLRAASWRPRPAEPVLVTLCRDQLYHLKTVQSTSATVNAGLPAPAQLVFGHASSLSTVPPNFPGLVDEFRSLLTRIAARVHEQGHRTVITVDELDRLGSDTQALAFLSEIKAVLGVPHVSYLISVAEDVGAAFVRRGLPHRDATDSSLDDIVHVQPCTLDESRTIIEKRAPGLVPPPAGAEAPPYVVLAHALSGGIPRDLIRYSRRIIEMHERTSSVELRDISRRLVLEELAETLTGFRTLLGKQPWTPENAGVLHAYRTLMAYLRTGCPCVTAALSEFAAEPPAGTAAGHALPEGAAHLIHEASAYAYYGLTLLQIFSGHSFERRRGVAALRGRAGDPHALAEARLELVLSPYSARAVIDEVRRAWDLPPVPAPAPLTAIPVPREERCEVHRPA